MLYKELVNLYEKLDSTSKRLEKTYMISVFLKTVPEAELKDAIALIQGKIFFDSEEKNTGISSQLIIKALVKTTGVKNIEDYWKKYGDLGSVAFEILSKKKQFTLVQKELNISEVLSKLRQLETYEGKGSTDTKLNVISELMLHSEPVEAKYIIRTVADNMRIGIGIGSLRDAIIWAYAFPVNYDNEKNEIVLSDEERKKYNESVELIQSSLDILNDISKLALILKKEGVSGLKNIRMKIGTPVSVMLYQKAKDVSDAFEIVGKPAAFEVKYDGFRIQVHVSDEIKLFTRRLDDVTAQFPDIVGVVKKNVQKGCILDAEAVGYDKNTGKYLPFQKISQRIKRKYEIEKMAADFPVELNVFDIIYHDNKELLNEPYEKRREMLEKSVKEEQKKIVLAKRIVTSDEAEARKFYEYSLSLGEEGCMAKNLGGIYKPGARVGYGVKIKSIMDPLDLVIVAAEYGEGKRSGMLSSFYLACMDDGEFKEIGKVSTGLKELEGEGVTFDELTKLLLPLIIKTDGKFVRIMPEIVIEVGYEEIQASESYSSGYALRFPRFLRLRNDEKTVDDINTIDDVEALYKSQRGRSN